MTKMIISGAKTLIFLVVMATLTLNVVGDCMQQCDVHGDLCLNNVEMNNWTEKFICIKTRASCRQGCASGRKRDYQDISSADKKVYQPKPDNKALRMLYRKMPKELLIELLIKINTSMWGWTENKMNQKSTYKNFFQQRAFWKFWNCFII